MFSEADIEAIEACRVMQYYYCDRAGQGSPISSFLPMDG